MHDHEYTITLLKTPFGFLTKDGFTDDINSKEIVLLPSNSYGKWTPFKDKIIYFGKYSSIPEDSLSLILENESECKIKTYLCEHGTDCCFFRNPDCKNSTCKFWNSDRNQLKMHRLY